MRVDATDHAEARQHVAERKLRILSIREVNHGLLQRWRQKKASFGKFDLLLFSQELLALLEAGLTLTEALEALHEKEQRPESNAIISALRSRLAAGERFASGLAANPSIFPPLYCGLMRAAEKTSRIEHALARFIEYRERIDQIRRHVTQALIYPAILCTVGLLVCLFLLGYVVPSFASVYQNAGNELPLASRLLLQWGKLIAEHGQLLATLGLACALLVGLAARHGQRWQNWRTYLLTGLRRLPRLGNALRTYELSRLYLALGTLLEGGLPILQAIELCEELVSPLTGESLPEAMRQISEGKPLSSAFDSAGLCTPVALRLIRVGERTGQMGEMLTRATRFHDGESARFVARFSRTFEPLLMAAIGIVIGIIVVLLYLPIFDLAGNFQ